MNELLKLVEQAIDDHRTAFWKLSEQEEEYYVHQRPDIARWHLRRARELEASLDALKQEVTI